MKTTMSRVNPDDFNLGDHLTVLRNRAAETSHFGHPVESDYLKGSVLRIVALNLPYLLVEAADPIRGRASIVVDVREHVFQRVNEEFVEAVLACSDNSVPNPHDKIESL